jgi:hypothetical protein
MDDEVWVPSEGRSRPAAVRVAPASSLPASLQACRRGASRDRPDALQKHYVLLCAPALIAGFIAITALEIGAGLGSPLVRSAS